MSPPPRLSSLGQRDAARRPQPVDAPFEGALVTTLLAPDVLITRFVGHISITLAEQRMYQFTTLLSAVQEPRWIMDLTAMSGFEPSAISVGDAWWRAFKGRNGREVLLASAHAAARMAAASLAFGVGLRVKTLANLPQCLAYFGLDPAVS